MNLWGLTPLHKNLMSTVFFKIGLLNMAWNSPFGIPLKPQARGKGHLQKHTPTSQNLPNDLCRPFSLRPSTLNPHIRGSTLRCVQIGGRCGLPCSSLLNKRITPCKTSKGKWTSIPLGKWKVNTWLCLLFGGTLCGGCKGKPKGKPF